jgi:hypothetical protein
MAAITPRDNSGSDHRVGNRGGFTFFGFGVNGIEDQRCQQQANGNTTSIGCTGCPKISLDFP